ncbi:MAG: copper chaperone PCu(A)C [Microthrixaceae bacterium]|nr:copper chaperone PCu(A)C [Microthrixaceae bacterium]
MNANHKLKRTVLAAVAVVLAAAGPLAACGSDDEAAEDTTTTTAADTASGSAVSIDDVWARPGTAGGNSAVYMEITGGDTDDALVGASVPTEVAESAEVHETVTDDGDDMTDDTMTDDGTSDDHMTDDSAADDHMTDDTSGDADDHGSDMMTMREVDSVAVPAGGSVDLEPGGYHVMLLNLAKDLAVGDTIEVTLDFHSGATEKVTAEVKEA